jgi:O-antigen/teichoic acid export membrane protein
MAGKKKLVVVNVISSGSQVLFVGVVYFLLYRYLLRQLGVEMLGVWSVVLSTSSLANLANFGVADSVVRFVALFIKEDDHTKIRQLIFTASIFIGALFLVIASIIYPFADVILTSVLPAKYLVAGLSILPYSLGCLILNAINGVYASVLDGMQKNYVRNIIFSGSSILLLVLAYVLVPRYGLRGVALAQVCQSVLALLFCLVNVTLYTRYNPLKWNWSKQIFKQIFSYGMKFQFISLAAMLNEPVTKILLGKFGGMAFAGYYEMANRVLMQARGVIVNGTQSLIPVMVHLSKDIKEVQEFYKKIFSNVLFFSLTAMGAIVISGHFIAFYWIGNYQPVFYNTVVILALSLFINILNTPAYFFYMAEGNLNILIKTHLILGLSNTILGYCLGFFSGGYGVIYGWFFAVFFGSLYILVIFNKMYDISLKKLFKTHDLLYAAIIIGLVAANNFFKIYSDKKIGDIIYLMIMMVFTAYYFFKYKVESLKINTSKSL